MSTAPAPVLVVAPFDDEVIAGLRPRFDLRRAGPAPGPCPLLDIVSPDELRDVRAIVCEVELIDGAALQAAPVLELVICCRSNPVNVDVEACARRGITVATTPARNADVTADLTIALLLDTVRQVSTAQSWLREGRWTSDDLHEPYRRFRGPGLSGRVLGVVGGGAVGRRVAQRARGFGMEVMISDPYLAPDDVQGLAEVVPLEELLTRCDVLTIHAPLSEATRGMIGAAELARLSPEAFVINAGRAAIIDEDALVAALTSGRLAGAGLDVFWEEPLPAGHPLLSLPGVVLTPHIGGASDDVVVHQSRLAARALEAWQRGEEPPAVWGR
jgi:D-3-phosphoglycerate dehydrogenase / 2-oxoglutarate reductase